MKKCGLPIETEATAVAERLFSVEVASDSNTQSALVTTASSTRRERFSRDRVVETIEVSDTARGGQDSQGLHHHLYGSHPN